MSKIVITGAARTAVGAYLGSLKTVPEEMLAKHVIEAALTRAGVEKTAVDEVIMGNVLNLEANLARVSLLLAGLPEEVPAFTVNRLCGSSLQAVYSAMQQIQCGEGEVVVAGGAESMSRYIYYLPVECRWEGFRLGVKKLYDTFPTGSALCQPPSLYPDTNMGITAENVAAKHHISRQAQDEFALHSQQKAKAAQDAGRFTDEIIPVELTDKKGTTLFLHDEHLKPDTTLESLAKLRPAFKKDGSVTAGNASGMNDGASAVVVMSEEKAGKLGCAPMVEVVAMSVTALDPRVMGLGPVSAIRKLLKKTGLSLEDIDLIELNEAFAAQSLGCLTELGMTPGTAMYERVNVNGGAIAHGHALGNSGTRLLNTLIYELRRRGAEYGIGALCCGGGQGIAILIRNMQ